MTAEGGEREVEVCNTLRRAPGPTDTVLVMGRG
eukprot:CAMPEP_0184669132 /NCGR_PEP_ID=MMETSP0308-20130426/75932_1 /TAXON_ID=38269 /ORGANISM="Gloeochaete witrockiana, Strain SAG 46.84" /LENGTH=32 /DNA_ID= /DNA_START= /DNA_END= /DNA_ORIENTATION=